MVTASPATTSSTSVRKRRGDSHRSSAGATATAAAASTPPVVVIPSPYHTVTQPRASVHSSSGHGSDCSYNPLGTYCGAAGRRRWGGVTGGASSGYESMLRDSEASSCHDTASEKSGPTAAGTKAPIFIGGARSATRRKPTHHQHRKSGGSRSRSRSAPPAEKEGENAEGDADSDSTKVDAATQRRLLDEEREEMEWQIRCEKVNELLCQQEQLKKELLQAKGLLMADPASWNFDLHVAESMDAESPGFLEALRKETSILRKRVHACKSHLMFVSCFDAKTVEDGE